jgi:hypothetical protein
LADAVSGVVDALQTALARATTVEDHAKVLTDAEAFLVNARTELVGYIRDQGGSWDDVAEVLGITKYEAVSRYWFTAPEPA